MTRAALLLALLAASACSPEAPEALAVRDAVLSPAPAGGTGALFLTLTGGPEADTLLAATSPVATQTALHESVDAGDGMRGMRPVDGVPVPARATVALAPGGTHAMLMGLHEALVPGDTLDATLTFARAGTVRIRAVVQPLDGLPATSLSR